MRIEVVLPDAARPRPCALEVPDGCCVAEALRRCGWREPAALRGRYGYGVFGVAVSPDTALRAGDRLEVCAPLRQTPNEARRRRQAQTP